VILARMRRDLFGLLLVQSMFLQDVGEGLQLFEVVL
jgi:hypothetical protein